ncbi:MAG: HU family DNA-binding protein, partial [Pseudomonas sp.]
GTFLQRHRGARTGKNPQTGEPVKIKASNTVAFKPGKSLKDSVNP